ncbi:MAG TPA: HAMP domain-containing sensor histidine kinase [Chthoniobacteraceae bacterium]|nr:HAMP domain-containing sensor histidine kinase [Chthoniobacteraceae bacterium]
MIERNLLKRITDSFVPPSLDDNVETARKARLIVAFGFLGAAFGYSYALFYLCIGHYWGAGIIIVCSTAAVTAPFLLRLTGSVGLAGNLQSLILTLGFFGLANVEGGVHGHAIAWLAAVPLCALLLADSRSALVWCVVCFAATAWFCVKDLAGLPSPLSYRPALHSLVTAVGFMGFTAFMSLLGLIFERGRARAYKKLADALVELSRANERLKRLYAEKDEFFGMAAHDIKNRIHVVRGLAELMMETPDITPGQVRLDADEIIHTSMKMQEELANLLAMDAIEEGRFQLTTQVCDLSQIASRVVRYYRSTAARKNVAIQYADSKSALAKVDPGAISQVMDNLLSNAIKYSPLGKTVHVALSNSGDCCTFSVRDEGPGFTEEDKRRLFTKFARLSANPTGGESSTGLGLSIVKKIVEAMGGEVRCESPARGGATFVVTLPASE